MVRVTARVRTGVRIRVRVRDGLRVRFSDRVRFRVSRHAIYALFTSCKPLE